MIPGDFKLQFLQNVKVQIKDLCKKMLTIHIDRFSSCLNDVK
jgi:hypothetical protein